MPRHVMEVTARKWQGITLLDFLAGKVQKLWNILPRPWTIPLIYVFPPVPQYTWNLIVILRSKLKMLSFPFSTKAEQGSFSKRRGIFNICTIKSWKTFWYWEYSYSCVYPGKLLKIRLEWIHIKYRKIFLKEIKINLYNNYFCTVLKIGLKYIF